jgi:hypothetical protein
MVIFIYLARKKPGGLVKGQEGIPSILKNKEKSGGRGAFGEAKKVQAGRKGKIPGFSCIGGDFLRGFIVKKTGIL